MSDEPAPAPVHEPDHLAKVVNDLAVALRDNDQLQAMLGQARADCGAWETRAQEYRRRADLAAGEATKWRGMCDSIRAELQIAQARLHDAQQELIDVKSQMAAMASHPDVKAARLGELRARAKELAAEMNRVKNA